MILFIARWVHEYSPLIIPIFIATMLISILLDLRLAIMVNVVLTVAISLMINNDFKFIYMALVTGTFSAFIVSKAIKETGFLWRELLFPQLMCF